MSVCSNIGILSKLRHFVTNEILLKLYYSLIYPFITYGLLIWGNTYDTSLNPIIILQKKTLRIMTFSKPDQHSDPLFKKLDLLKFKDLVFLYNATYMYQFHHNLLPKAFNNLFHTISSVHHYKTRLASRSSYYIPSIRTNYGKFNLQFTGPTIWNSLDEHIKTLPLKSFKNRIKSDLIQSYI